jgi:hypothetical protein
MITQLPYTSVRCRDFVRPSAGRGAGDRRGGTLGCSNKHADEGAFAFAIGGPVGGQKGAARGATLTLEAGLSTLANSRQGRDRSPSPRSTAHSTRRIRLRRFAAASRL